MSRLIAALSVAVSTTALLAPASAEPRIILPYGNDYVVSRPARTMPQRLSPIAGDEAPQPSSDYRLAVFLNFDGAKLTSGGSDAKTNKTSLIGAPSYDYPALKLDRFGGREDAIKEVITELKLLFGAYAVEFVAERPSSGDYTMAMIGGRGEGIAGGDAVGLSPLDCNNTDRNDIVLIFGELLDSTKQLALVIAHELGHSFGLEHVSDSKGIMYPALTSETCCWVDSSLSEMGTCGRTRQDANEVLLDNLGAGPGDEISPLVWMMRPGAEATVPPNFAFEVGAADDLRVHHVVLYVDGKKKIELSRAPFVVALTGLSDGEHVLKAEVFDWKPNTTATELTVMVDSSCPAEGRCFVGAAGVGAQCSGGEDCTSGLCATKGDSGVCAAVCERQESSCPDDTSCQELDADWVCLADEGDGWALDKVGKGCAVAGKTGLDGPALLLLLLLIRRRQVAQRVKQR